MMKISEPYSLFCSRDKTGSIYILVRVLININSVFGVYEMSFLELKPVFHQANLFTRKEKKAT